MMNNKEKGFTLIELLIVIAVMAILTTVVFVALNPLARFQDTRNSRRSSDVDSILAAIKLNQIDNEGYYLDGTADGVFSVEQMVEDTYYQIGIDTTGCGGTFTYGVTNEDLNDSLTIIPVTCVDLLGLIDSGHMSKIPVDPYEETAGEGKTGYYIYKYSTGQIDVGALYPEQGSEDEVMRIEVSR